MAHSRSKKSINIISKRSRFGVVNGIDKSSSNILKLLNKLSKTSGITEEEIFRMVENRKIRLPYFVSRSEVRNLSIKENLHVRVDIKCSRKIKPGTNSTGPRSPLK